MRSCELTLFSVALRKCPLKGTEISSRKRNGRQNANTHFWQEQSSEQPHCGVTWTRGESQSGERGGLRNGWDEHGVEAAPLVLRGQREGNFSYSYPLLPLARRWENSSCGQSFSGNFKMHEMQFPAQKIFAGLNA